MSDLRYEINATRLIFSGWEPAKPLYEGTVNRPAFRREDDQSFNHVPQLTDVARPVGRLQRRHGVVLDIKQHLSVLFADDFEKMRDKQVETYFLILEDSMMILYAFVHLDQSLIH